MQYISPSPPRIRIRRSVLRKLCRSASEVLGRLPKFAGLATQFSGVIAKHDRYTEMSRSSRYPAVSRLPVRRIMAITCSIFGGALAARWQNEGNFTADYSYDCGGRIQHRGLPDVDGRRYRPSGDRCRPADRGPAGNDVERLFNPGFPGSHSGHNLTLARDLSDAITLKWISGTETQRRGGNSSARRYRPARVRPVSSTPGHSNTSTRTRRARRLGSSARGTSST